jgi:hypothetical protein
VAHSFDNLSTYLITMVDEAINSTMHLNGYGGSTEKGFDGGDPPAKVSPLGGRYEGSTFVPGGRITDPTGTLASSIHFNPGWPFHDLQSMQDYYWKRVNELFEDWYWIPTPTPPGATPGFDGPIAGARSTASDLVFQADEVQTAGSTMFGGDPQLGSDLHDLDQLLTGLDGDAIRTFKLVYAYPLKDVTASQEAVACAIWVAVAGEQKVWEKARQGIADIAGQGVEAMKSAKGGGGGDLSVLLDVIGSVADIAGLFKPVEAAAKVVSTANSVIKTAYGDLPKPKPDNAPLHADTPIGVLDKIHEAIETLKSQIKGEEAGIQHAMTTDHATLTDPQEQRSFSLGTPALLSDTHGGDFKTANDIAIKFSDLKFAATTVMPRLSTVFRHASRGLADVISSEASWKRPAGIGLGATGPFPEVRTLASTLGSYLDANAQNIDHAATILEVVARDFHKTEDQISADLQALQKNLAGHH